MKNPPAIPPPKPAAAVRTARPGLRVLLLRVAMLSIVVGCVILAYWSATRRLMPASRQLRDRTIEMTGLANEVQSLEMKWDAAEVQRTEERFLQAQTLLFQGEDGIAGWQTETERQANGFALAPRTHSGKATPRSVGGQKLALVPVTLDLQPLTIHRTTNSPYKRLLSFSRLLETSDKRVDLLDISITGDSNSVHQAKLVFEAWSQENIATP